MRILTSLIIVTIGFSSSYGQGCCSGGSGSPIAGGAATGVLQEHQMELSANYQFNQSNKFFTQNRDTTALFENLTSDYLFFRVDYGITKKLTFSVASGYYLNRTLFELENEDTISTSGIGDLIIFPRFDIYNKTKDNHRTEITLGLGVKLPLGSHLDSNLVFSHPIAGDFYTISPPTVQATTGSSDMMFYSFFYRGYPKRKLRFFANTLYVKKSFNSLGEKFGDFASVGLFVGKTLFGKLGLTAQIKGEWIAEMEAARGVDLLANYNVEQESTGSKKLFFVPQISYTVKSLTIFATSDIPLYQYVNGTQVGSQYQITAGLNYRFLVKEPEMTTEDEHSEESH